MRGIPPILPALAASLYLACLAIPARAATNAHCVIASWNVENLFDPYNDPANPGATNFTPNGWTRWTPARYRQKLDHLGEVIAAMRPDILCLTEIENRRVLEDLVQTLHEQQRYDLPVILHREGGDRRGIDVAMLARVAPVATNWVAPVPEQRDLLIARFVIDGRPLTIVLNHWKSWVGDAAANVRIRTTEARASRREVERRLAEFPSAAVMALGDFNDNADSDSLTNAAGFTLYGTYAGTNVTGVLYNLDGGLPTDQRGTYYYGKDRVWNSFDSMSVSHGMLPGLTPTAPWRVVPGSYGPFILPQQKNADGEPLPFHRVRKKDAHGVVRDTYLTGYSDHFPVRVELE